VASQTDNSDPTWRALLLSLADPRQPNSRLKAWTPNARQAVWSLALQGEVRPPYDAESLEAI
jgi:hypothetical protein